MSRPSEEGWIEITAIGVVSICLIALVVVGVLSLNFLLTDTYSEEAARLLERAGYRNISISSVRSSIGICSDDYQAFTAYFALKGMQFEPGIICEGLAISPSLRPGVDVPQSIPLRSLDEIREQRSVPPN